MRSTADIGVGSLSDKIHAVAMTLRACESLAAVESRYSHILRTLDQLAERIARARRSGSVPMPVAPALKWLHHVVQELPALDEPGGEGLRAELLAAIARLRLLAGR
jgi:hypothetical protein